MMKKTRKKNKWEKKKREKKKRNGWLPPSPDWLVLRPGCLAPWSGWLASGTKIMKKNMNKKTKKIATDDSNLSAKISLEKFVQISFFRLFLLLLFPLLPLRFNVNPCCCWCCWRGSWETRSCCHDNTIRIHLFPIFALFLEGRLRLEINYAVILK